MKSVFVTGGFDNLQSRHVRFFEEAAKLGTVHVNLWSDETIRFLTGAAPKLSEAERMYFVQALRTVSEVGLVEGNIDPDKLPLTLNSQPECWVVLQEQDTQQKRAFCNTNNIIYHVVGDTELSRFPLAAEIDHNDTQQRKKVIVTGCFDWLHSGHVRFFEETSALGDLYVVLGHDQNVLLLKGEGHPLFPETERRYMVQSIRYVKQALVSSGSGWMDAAPEIDLIKPDMYAVNEDGDNAEKRAFCEAHDIEYIVLRRLPKEGLPKRESTALRGF
jgi:cytidyltransferase-like protein